MNRVLLRWYCLFKDAVFPSFCLSCKQEGSLLCENCYRLIDTSGVSVCPVCHITVQKGKPCERCIFLTPLNSHLAVSIFEENNLLGKLIHSYKYNFLTDAFFIFENLIQDFFQKNKNHYTHIDFVVPVPLHRRRLAERGFNQAEEIGEIVAKILNVPLQNILFRMRATAQQAKLGKQERIKNVEEAFALQTAFDIKNKNILLVDDVFTTGSTVGACAKLLKSQGAGELHAFTLARG